MLASTASTTTVLRSVLIKVTVGARSEWSTCALLRSRRRAKQYQPILLAITCAERRQRTALHVYRLQAKTSLNPNFKRFYVDFSSPSYGYGTPLTGSSFYYEVNVLYVHMMALRKKTYNRTYAENRTQRYCTSWNWHVNTPTQGLVYTIR